ncbi:MAG: shikimate kinase, partial [Chloroflexota bacterium]
MCAGKSSVGLALAEHMGLAFVETDAIIEERAGMTIA